MAAYGSSSRSVGRCTVSQSEPFHSHSYLRAPMRAPHTFARSARRRRPRYLFQAGFATGSYGLILPITALPRLADVFRAGRHVSKVPIVLQKSFCVTEQN